MIADRSSIWCGTINDAFAVGGRVGLYDTTLRDGEQTVGVFLSPSQKVELASAIDALGVDRIEAGSPCTSADDYRAAGLILEAGLRAEIWGFARTSLADVAVLRDLGLQASVIEGPVSDTKLQTLGVSREEMLSRIRSVVEAAAGSGIKVAFFGVDGSRADPAFLRQAYETAVEAGAVEAVVVDTLGIASPEAVAELVGTVRAWLGKDVAIHFHGHNDFGVATACAVAAVRAGADWIHGTINGMGERAGNANLLEVALALEALFRVETNVDLRGARVVSELVREACDYRLEPWKPVTGENLFRRESAAIAAQFHQPEAIEPYSSSLVGLQREIVLGRKSGLASIRIACEELGVSLDADTQQRLLERVHEFSTRQRSVLSTDDLRDLIASLDGHG